MSTSSPYGPWRSWYTVFALEPTSFGHSLASTNGYLAANSFCSSAVDLVWWPGSSMK